MHKLFKLKSLTIDEEMLEKGGGILKILKPGTYNFCNKISQMCVPQIGWGSGFQRINTMCQEYGVARPEFTEIGDMFRVNFYRHSNNEKTAINLKSGDKTAINAENGDKSGDKLPTIPENGDKKTKKFKNRIVKYLTEHDEARSQEISAYIGLKISRTKVYLSELVDEGKITPNGANKNRTYSLKK